MYQYLSPEESYESSDQNISFEKIVETQLLSKLGHIKGLEINPPKEGSDFLLVWKDSEGITRAIILECKYSDLWNTSLITSEEIKKLHKYKSFIEENVDWKIELLVMLTYFPFSIGKDDIAYEKEDVLVLDVSTMLNVFIEEFISWHSQTIIK